MADYTHIKTGVGDVSPVGADDSSWGRLQPLLTAKQLRNLHLFGIPLVSGMRGPDNKFQVLTDEMVDDFIAEAVSLAETELMMEIFPTEITEKVDFDANLFKQLGYLKLKHRPISSIEALTVTPANGVDVYSVPLDWIETAFLQIGQINVIPINIATTGGGFIPAAASTSGGAAFFLSILGQRPWIPAFWQVRYTAGFPDGKIPRELNALIGTVAAMEILSNLAATYAKSTGHSVGIDGLSQSISTPGPQLFAQRLEELAAKRKFLVNKIKARYMNLIFSGNV